MEIKGKSYIQSHIELIKLLYEKQHKETGLYYLDYYRLLRDQKSIVKQHEKITHT